MVEGFSAIGPGVAKIVGVSDDYDAVAAAQQSIADELGDRVAAATSQPYYLDITHPRANKGARRLVPVGAVRDPAGGHRDDRGRPERRPHVRPLGPLRSRWGTRTEDVQRAAQHVTTSNEEDGFANAVDRFILGRS